MRRRHALLDKLWAPHELVRQDDGASVFWIDRHLMRKGSHRSFAKIAERGSSVAEPALTSGVVDHYAPTQGPVKKALIVRMIGMPERDCADHGITSCGFKDKRQGIVHVIGPEQGLTLKGLPINRGDSHPSTHGVFGTLAFGIGTSEVAHMLPTQSVWQTKPKSMRITFEGTLGPSVGAKDLALAWIGKPGSDAARVYAIEYIGAAARFLSIEGRITLCNLSIEGGARFGMVGPDETTFDYVERRPFAPSSTAWDQALSIWLALPTDQDAIFDREVAVDASEIAPVVTRGTSPEDALSATSTVPDLANMDEVCVGQVDAALEKMDLSPGQALSHAKADQVFIGSCTNARVEDLRAAAAVLANRKARVPGVVSPGSQCVKAPTEAEGFDCILTEAGRDRVGARCSMCVSMNGDMVAPVKRCASTSDRNFPEHQGPRLRTHLMSPAMMAAAAVTGDLTHMCLLIDGQAV